MMRPHRINHHAKRFHAEPLESRRLLSAVGIIDPVGNGLNGSTFNSGSFQIENTSTTGRLIDRLVIDLSSAMLPDVVFDPFGLAGDVDAKGFTVDAEGGVGYQSFTYLAPHDGGYDALEVLFSDFDPGETFSFSVDVDPTSIQGTAGPGPGESGSVSGLELTGATLSVEFSDSETLTGAYFGGLGDVDASQAFVSSGLPAIPTIDVQGVTTPGVVGDASQVVRITGPAGAAAHLLVAEGALFLEGAGFDVDPFEANSVVGFTTHQATIGAQGFVDVAVTLAQSLAEGGVNHLAAAIEDGAGATGLLSTVEVVQYDASAPAALRINAGGPAYTDLAGDAWLADAYFVGGAAKHRYRRDL